METMGKDTPAEPVPGERAPFSSVPATLGRNYRVQSYGGGDSILNNMGSQFSKCSLLHGEFPGNKYIGGPKKSFG